MNTVIQDTGTDNKSMGLFSAASIGVGAMIGAGIFALIGVAVEIAGQLAWLAFILAGITAFLSSYSVSKLAVQFPSKGGVAEYINQGFGRGVFSGTLNIVMWIGYVVVTSLYVRAFGEYGVALVSPGKDTVWVNLLGSAVLVLFVIINFTGAKAVGKSELIIVSIKLVVLIGFAVLGLSTAETHGFSIGSDFHLRHLLLAAGVVFMSYEGFGLVANTAEDVESPETTLPKALFISVAVAMAVYCGVTIAVIGNLSVSEILNAKEYALAEAARPVMGSTGFFIMGLAALFSTSSAINATIYGPVHMLQETAMAGQIPSFFTGTLFGHKSGTALMVTGLAVLAVSNLMNLEAIAETGSLIFLVIYTAVCIANFRLRKKTSSNVYLVLAGIATALFSFATLLYFEIREGEISAWIFAGIFAAGFLSELVYRKFRKTS